MASSMIRKKFCLDIFAFLILLSLATYLALGQNSEAMIIYSFSLETHELHLFTYQEDELGTLETAQEYLTDLDKELVFATNGAIFDKGFSHLGLMVQNNVQLSELNTNEGEGNFFFQPNGVFFIVDGQAQILSTEDYAVSEPSPKLAFQSGPLLIIDSTVNPDFSADSESRFTRGGICFTTSEEIVLAVSLEKMSLYEFSEGLLELNCTNVLYLDGTITGYIFADNGFNKQRTYASILAVTER